MSTEHGAIPAASQHSGQTPGDSQDDSGAERLTLQNGLTVRPWADGDDLRLLEIWGDPENAMHHQDRSLLRPSSNRPWSRCVVAEDDGVPVAAATVLRSSLHPDRLSFYAEVAPEHRRRGTAAQLLQILEAEAPNCPTQSLKARCAQWSAAQCFLKDNGFVKIQASRRVTIQPGALELPDLQAAGLELEDAATGSVELSRLVADFYNTIHADWDPAQMSLGNAQQLLLAPETGASGAVVLREASDDESDDDGRALAFAISYTPQRTEDPADVLLGWNPVLDEDQSEAEADAVCRAMLAMLTARHPVTVEVDDSMAALKRVTEELVQTDYADDDFEAFVYARDAA